MACGAPVIDACFSSLKEGCFGLEVSVFGGVCLSSFDVFVGTGPCWSRCTGFGGPSGLCSITSVNDALPISFNGAVFLDDFGGALRLSRWTTSPEGRISLTRKSVYLCMSDTVLT